MFWYTKRRRSRVEFTEKALVCRGEGEGGQTLECGLAVPVLWYGMRHDVVASFPPHLATRLGSRCCRALVWPFSRSRTSVQGLTREYYEEVGGWGRFELLFEVGTIHLASEARNRAKTSAICNRPENLTSSLTTASTTARPATTPVTTVTTPVWEERRLSPTTVTKPPSVIVRDKHTLGDVYIRFLGLAHEEKLTLGQRHDGIASGDTVSNGATQERCEL